MINRFYKIIHNKYSRILRFIFFLRYLFAIFLSSIAIFLAIPNFFNYEQRAEIIKNHLIKKYKFDLNEYEIIQYQALPLPKLIVKNAKIEIKSSPLKLSVEHLIIYPKLLSIYNYEKFQTNKIILQNNKLNLKASNFQFLTTYYLNQKNKIFFDNLNLLINDGNKSILSFKNIKLSNYGYNKNLITGKVFKKNFKIKISNNFKNINFNLLKSGLKGEINFKDIKRGETIEGVFKSKILNTNLKFDFIYNKDKLKINNTYFRNKDLSFKNESLIILEPFLDANLKFSVEDINTQIFKKLDIEEILASKNIIKKINSKNEINFKSKKLSRNLIDDLNLQVDLAYGRANYNKKIIISKSFFECKGNINFLEEYPLLFFDCAIISENKKNLLKKFSIKIKDKQKSFKLFFNGSLNILNKKINFDNIILNKNYQASKEDLEYFENTFKNIIFNETFIKIFDYDKIKKFILEIT